MPLRKAKPTWILNYSWDGDKKVDRREAMMNLAMSQIMAGANFWDAPGHSMGGSNDLPPGRRSLPGSKRTRRLSICPRTPIHPVGVYFSPTTRNYYAEEFIRSYRGILILLMQKHLEFQIVTPRTLADFKGETLILPNVSHPERNRERLVEEIRHGRKTLIVTGTDATQLGDVAGVVRFENCPGKAYITALQLDFDNTLPDSQARFLRASRGGTPLTFWPLP